MERSRIFELVLHDEAKLTGLFRPFRCSATPSDRVSDIDAARSVAEAPDEIASRDGDGPGVEDLQDKLGRGAATRGGEPRGDR